MIEFELKRTGLLIVVSAPSGGGKSTIIRALLASENHLSYSISATTRRPRHNEIHGRDYYFYSEEEFRRLIAEDAFLEYATVHDNFYGTLRSEVDRLTAAGQDVILDVDVQGSLAIKRQNPDCTSIFVLPPSMATLEKRLRERGSDDEDVIRRRLINARGEVRMAERYDYILVNRELEDTLRNVRTIIAAQRFRSSRVHIRDSKESLLASASGEA